MQNLIQTPKSFLLAPQNKSLILQAQLQFKNLNFQQLSSRLFETEDCTDSVLWFQNQWFDPQFLQVTSLQQVKNILNKQSQVLWSYCSLEDSEDGNEIIQISEIDKINRSIQKPQRVLDFNSDFNQFKKGAGSWAFLNKNTLIYSQICSSPFPNGEALFKQNKSCPNRAYLKLWNLFCILGIKPLPNQQCLDLGASPGGWSWVLANIGCQVHAVDRTELDPQLMENPNVVFIKKNAFLINPTFGSFDWVFIDLACYPQKLLEYVNLWVQSSQVKQIVATIKFQGETNFEIIQQFSTIPNSKLFHLFYNKHELTFFWSQK